MLSHLWLPQCLSKLARVCILYNTIYPRINAGTRLMVFIDTKASSSSRGKQSLSACVRLICELSTLACPCTFLPRCPAKKFYRKLKFLKSSTEWHLCELCVSVQTDWQPCIKQVGTLRIVLNVSSPKLSFFFAVYLRPELLYQDLQIDERIAEQAALVTSPLQLLAALPIMQQFLDKQIYSKAAPVALVALKALRSHRDRWNALLGQ